MLSALIFWGVAAQLALSDNWYTRGPDSPFLSYLMNLPLRLPTILVDVTVLSRNVLNPARVRLWWVYNPTLGRYCPSRMTRADSEEANRGVDMDSRPRQHHYPQGNFFDRIGSHQGRHYSSLGLSFEFGFLSVRNPVRLTFALYSLLRISDSDELTFGRPWYLFRGVPPQPNRPSCDVPSFEG